MGFFSLLISTNGALVIPISCFPVQWDLQTYYLLISCSATEAVSVLDTDLSPGAVIVIVLTVPKHTEALTG